MTKYYPSMNHHPRSSVPGESMASTSEIVEPISAAVSTSENVGNVSTAVSAPYDFEMISVGEYLILLISYVSAPKHLKKN